ncbi:MAG: hypothetical protein AABZ74_18430 [Cyanobacteriota bacterium]
MLKKILLSTFFAITLNSNVFANVAGLSNPQLQQLKALGISVVLPSYIPKGFEVDKVEAVIAKFSGMGTAPKTGDNHYKVTYSKKLKDGKTSEFSIETVAWGVGDVMQTNPIKVKTKIGEFLVYIDSNFVPNNKKLKNCIDTEWVSYKNTFYRITSGSGCRLKDDVDDNSVQRVSNEDILKILKSLQVIK